MVKFAREWTRKFSIFIATVTLNEGQGHPNRYQHVELCVFYHHSKFERNESVHISIHANVKVVVVVAVVVAFNEVIQGRFLS